ncbi:MAG: NfeD family protein [Phycisphaerales bacterium]
MLRALSVWWSLPARVRVCVPLLALVALLVGGAGQSGGTKPAQSGRISQNVVIITMEGDIDAITSVSMRRQIAEAERTGADALVVRINSPGGELGAVIEITSALKRTSITRTIAWVDPKAYSGGAITALACQEIVVSGGAWLGDAAPIFVTKDAMGRPVLVPLPETERAKFLGPLLAEVVSSARKNGYDEKLVQGMVTLGVELWLVENAETHERLFIDRAEYELLFDGKPPTSNPRLVGAPPDGQTAPVAVVPTPAAQGSSPTDLQPASPKITKQAAQEASMGLTTPSLRPVLTDADKGKWTLVEYVSDGRSLFTLSDTDMLHLRMATARVNSEAELKAYLGATNTITLSQAWYEGLARFMRNFWVRGILVILVILGLFIELIHPGLIIPGSVAVVAVLVWLLPEILLGLAGWWEPVLIVGGVALIGVELFLLPGIGIAGAVGLLSLLVGLVMAFVPASSAAFPGVERSSGVAWGVGFVVVGFATAGVIGYYMSKNMRTLPVLSRLILTDRPPDEDRDGDEGSVATEVAQSLVAVGQEGIAITSLRPSGKAEFGGRVIDVVSDGPVIDPGRRVRVVAAAEFRVVVEGA